MDGVTSDEVEVIVTVTEVKAYAGDDVEINEGDAVTLTATGGDSYQWNTGVETTSSITVSPEATAEYSVTVFKDGCQSTDKVQVTVNSVSMAPVTAKLNEDMFI